MGYQYHPDDMNKIAAAGWAGELPDPDREGKT
jgi:hypothetical protein